MHTQLIAAVVTVAMSGQDLVTYQQGLFGPLFLGIVGIVAIFFLFIREVIGACSSSCLPSALRSSFTCQASCRCLQRVWRTRSESTDPESGRRSAPL